MAGKAGIPDALGEGLKRLSQVQPSSPKRPVGGASTEEWYSYYAGYADGFVKEIVATMALPSTSIVLDPWNGAGTTTSVATAHGLRSIGIDLNPAAVVIARARLLGGVDVGSSVAAMTRKVIASSAQHLEPCRADEPLRNWFEPRTAARLRAVERAIYSLLIPDDDPDGRLLDPRGIDRVDSFNALFYLGLFRTIRPFMTRFIGSNPTWIKRSVDPDQLVMLSAREIGKSYRAEMTKLLEVLSRAGNQYERDMCPTSVRVASSDATGLGEDSVDAVITSPPYCTRIDYVIATLPELATLGLRAPEMADLRARMIGTPVVRGVQHDDELSDPVVRTFMDQVAAHDSRAAKTYYWKFYRSYFGGMDRSFTEINRVARSGSPLVFVAQDSYFKQLRVPVPEVLVEMGQRKGWTFVGRHDYPVLTNRAGMHQHARTYRSSTRATETVLIFTTA